MKDRLGDMGESVVGLNDSDFEVRWVAHGFHGDMMGYIAWNAY